MDEHARGTLRFIKLFTELSFTSFQVTQTWGHLPGMSQSKGGVGTSLHGADRDLGKQAWPRVTQLEQSQRVSPGIWTY